MKTYDLIVIGGGAGGLTVAAGASSLGAKVALIEKEQQPGGDCLHYGCVPSKTLISIANRIYNMRSASSYGLHATGTIRMTEVKERIQEVISHIQVHDDADRFRKLGVDIYIGKGNFLNEHEVEIQGNETIYGKRMVLSTGSRPFIPNIEGLQESGFLTNETIFDLESLPKKLAVIGGGPIGIELAQAFSRLGSEVTVFERGKTILPKEDKEIRERAFEFLSKEMHFSFEASVTRIKEENGQKQMTVMIDGTEEELVVDAILLATGRIPNSDQLELKNAGIHVDQQGYIPVNERLQTNVSHIYAIGDVNGTLPFTHVAGLEGKLVVQNAVLGLRRKIQYSEVPWVTYTTPEIFHLGETEEELKDKNQPHLVYQTSLSEVDRFVADGETEGLVKILTDQKGRIIGAHAIGKGAGDWMQTVVLAMKEKKKIGDLSQMVYPYPNHAAAIQRTADSYWREKLFQGWIPRLIKKYIQTFR
ncbi:FAD-dependent oxidoreductase [Cytobacillus spongiae]|uniref:dihydrolipoyl dehydrogenase family protein n=1 Tax=Cytobacillus spongiae TaxID=2901381 RepID=UPI001F2D51AB|nr:FAD-dependent oxidoreductase [Cytobacillus spongiae]UII54154.1 FAD-dependent oxidoreductase [Cytobacillus spongiae]